ncbi:hypothetical protein MKX07_004551 [Trichoderma sp. CBMAI-0711]|nr:hypothetical protein MKX07_004551 [Trichoderma sp. CBMAI-0711]
MNILLPRLHPWHQLQKIHHHPKLILSIFIPVLHHEHPRSQPPVRTALLSLIASLTYDGDDLISLDQAQVQAQAQARAEADRCASTLLAACWYETGRPPQSGQQCRSLCTVHVRFITDAWTVSRGRAVSALRGHGLSQPAPYFVPRHQLDMFLGQGLPCWCETGRAPSLNL